MAMTLLRVPVALALLMALGRVYCLQGNNKAIRYSRLSALETIIDPSYNLALGSLSIGLAGVSIEKFVQAKPFPDPSKVLTSVSEKIGLVLVVFGLFFGYQTATLRFAFDANSDFKLMKAGGESIGENIVVGGENKWSTKSFVNYDFLPSKSFPILVYFKEVQTPKDNWIEVPIVVDDASGQGHFFPAIANVDQLDREFDGHGCRQIKRVEGREVTFRSTPNVVL